MRDATGAVQSVLVLGGNSDIANAVIDQLVGSRLKRVYFAVRDPESITARLDALADTVADARALVYDADDVAAHDSVLEQCGEVDVILLAFGALGEPYDLEADTETVARLAHTNYVGGVAAAHASARHLVHQGHGTLVVFSSVAGVRVRAANAVYGSAKAGLDGFALGLADAVQGTGAHVMVVRPGFVHTKMTADLDTAPFATTPDKVAADVIAGLKRNQRVVWSPAVLRAVFGGLRTLPTPVWRRLMQ
ncbi:MAG: SDR family NAD(P)-dependent oxidoreductase [Acidimicrobiales bacterium]